MSSTGGQLRKYKRVKYLGKGSYGAAILVELRSDPKQKFVIKEIVIGHLRDDEQAAARKEAEVLHQMQHSNITMYVESFVENSKLFIVMEYADGGDLSTTIAKRKKSNAVWSENEVMRIFVQICLALKHVHEHNILHRDLKSQNIFLTSKGLVKLGDFGIAKVLDSTEDQARTQIGTPYYLSPEICESLPYGRQSDIWSLGVILFELLTFELPFQAQSLPALIHRICNADPPFDKIHRTYSSSIIDLAKSLLKKNHKERPSLPQVVASDFFKAHISKLLSHTLKVGTGGVVAEKVDHEADSGDAKAGANDVDPEEIDRDIEKARRMQKVEDAARRAAHAGAERETHRQEEREKLRKFRENMARNIKNGGNNNNHNNNDIVIAKPAAQMIVAQYPASRRMQESPKVNKDLSVFQQQEERIRELERQVKEQQRRAKLREQEAPARMMVPPPQRDGVHNSPSRVGRSLLEMQQRGEIEVRNLAPTNAKRPDTSDEYDIVRQQFFDNRAAAAAVKARVEAERGHGVAIPIPAAGRGMDEHRGAVSDYEEQLEGEARIAQVRANRERTKEAELEERDRQLKLAYQINREERRLLAERANEREIAARANIAFEISMNDAGDGKDETLGQTTNVNVHNSRPSKFAADFEVSANSVVAQRPGILIARGHFYRDDNEVLRQPKQDEAVNASKPIFDRAHLDDDIADGKDSAVLQKLHDRRQRDKEARDKARVVFRRLQEQRRKAAEGNRQPVSREEPSPVIIKPRGSPPRNVSDASEDEQDLENNIASWLSRQHNDFLLNKKAAAEAPQHKQADSSSSPGGELGTENEVADLQCMLANALLSSEEKE